jgi:hemolysin III
VDIRRYHDGRRRWPLSTLYHSSPLPRARAVLRIFDHSAIFLLIAGTLIRQKALVTALPYVGMGWVAIVGIKPMLNAVAPGGLALLLADTKTLRSRSAA